MSAPEPATPAPAISRGRAVLALGLAVLLALAAYLLVGQAAHLGRIRTALDAARRQWLPVCLAGQLLAYAGYVLAYRDVARATGGPRFSVGTAARVVVFGAGANVLGASVGGLAVDFWALRRAGTPAHTATRRVLAVGTIEWTILSLYACAAALAVVSGAARGPAAMAIGWLVVVPACVLAARWFTAPDRVSRYIDPPPRPGHGLAATARSALADAIAGVVLVRHVLSHPRRYHGGIIGYPIYWAAQVLTLLAAVRAFGGHPGLAALVLAYATAIVISALPLPAGGAGSVDAGIALALHAAGVALAPAALAALVFRLFTFWLPVLPAVLLLPSIRRLDHTLESVPHTPPDPDERMSFRPAADAAATRSIS